jgi:hypothetical protein
VTRIAAEASWAIVYAAIGEAQPWVWLVPLVVAAVTAVTFQRTTIGTLA